MSVLSNINNQCPVFAKNAMGTWFESVRTLVTELKDDIATVSTWEVAADAAITELVSDHATFKTVVDDLKTLVNNLRTRVIAGVFGNPAFAISANYDIANANALTYMIGGVLYSLAATQTFDTGTSQVIAINKWSSALLSIDSSGTKAVTWSATLNAAVEADAVAALPATPANTVVLGYFTVLTGSGVTWTAGTDALAGGTGGTPAATTNYKNVPFNSIVSLAVSTSAPATLTNPAPGTPVAAVTAATPTSLA